MDEKAFNELLECSVCLEQLDDTNKVLPCQHTFCKRCLEEIVSTKHELRCPECRSLVEIQVDDLPSNLLLIRLLEGMKTQSHISSSQGYKKDQTGSPGNCRGGDNTSRQKQQRQASATNRPCAKAVFNYEGREPDDLSLKKGDLVYLKRLVDENWYEGELNGKQGYFPATYVQILTVLPSNIPQCKGLYDFSMDENEGDCLAFRKDDFVTVIRKVDDNWLEGKKGDKIGIFPMSFVELNEPAKILLQMTDKINASVTSNPGPPATPAHPERSQKEGCVMPSQQMKRHSLSNLSQIAPSLTNVLQRRSLDSNTEPEYINTNGNGISASLQSNSDETSLISFASNLVYASSVPIASSTPSVTMGTQVLTSQQHNVSTSTEPSEVLVATNKPEAQKAVPASLSIIKSQLEDSTTSSQSSHIFVALYNYKPQKADEIELQKDDYYSVCEKCMDGWCKGKALRTGQTGVFPGNYVQYVKSQNCSSKSSNRPDIVTKSGTYQPTGISQPVVSPPRPKTSSSEAAGRSRTKSELEERTVGESDVTPPPIVPRNPQGLVPLPTGKASSSSPISPVLPSTYKATRYVRSLETASPVLGAKSEPSSNTNSVSPAWKHSLSASANITPPNVVAGATGNSTPANIKEKEKKKEKEKISLMKMLKGQKKSKNSDTETASLSDSSVSSSRSSSNSTDISSLLPLEPSHKKSGSIDFSAIITPQKPVRPKPIMREMYRCVESYPAQSEIELDLKIGDIIFVHKKRDDGWFKGTLQRSGKMGLFPGSFASKCQ